MNVLIDEVQEIKEHFVKYYLVPVLFEEHERTKAFDYYNPDIKEAIVDKMEQKFGVRFGFNNVRPEKIEEKPGKSGIVIYYKLVKA
jgi:hypothetical protein